MLLHALQRRLWIHAKGLSCLFDVATVSPSQLSQNAKCLSSCLVSGFTARCPFPRGIGHRNGGPFFRFGSWDFLALKQVAQAGNIPFSRSLVSSCWASRCLLKRLVIRRNGTPVFFTRHTGFCREFHRGRFLRCRWEYLLPIKKTGRASHAKKEKRD